VRAAFSQTVRDEVELERLTDHLLDIVDETIARTHFLLTLDAGCRMLFASTDL
jgi:hypothetical protein